MIEAQKPQASGRRRIGHGGGGGRPADCRAVSITLFKDEDSDIRASRYRFATCVIAQDLK